MATSVRLIAGVLGVLVCAASNAPARTLGTVSGQATDAAGRPLANVRVELLEGGASLRWPGRVVQATLTGVQGAWTFGRVPSGQYVVRVMVGGHAAGVPVTVGSRPVDRVLVVAPSAAMRSLQGGSTSAAGSLGYTGLDWALIGSGIVGGAVIAPWLHKVGPFRDDQS